MKMYRVLFLCFSLLFCGAGLNAATKADAIADAVILAVVENYVSQPQKEESFVQFSKEKQARFDELFAQALAVIDKHGLEKKELGIALEYWLADNMVYVKEERAQEQPEEKTEAEAEEENSFLILTESEARAALYAVSVLIPAEYREGGMYTAQYREEHPVSDWKQYRKDCMWAMDLLFDSIQAVAEEQPNFEYSILKSLTH